MDHRKRRPKGQPGQFAPVNRLQLFTAGDNAEQRGESDRIRRLEKQITELQAESDRSRAESKKWSRHAQAMADLAIETMNALDRYRQEEERRNPQLAVERRRRIEEDADRFVDDWEAGRC